MSENVGDFAKSFKEFMNKMSDAAETGEAYFPSLFKDYFGMTYDKLRIVTHSIPEYDHANLQIALNSWLKSKKREHELIGVNDRVSWRNDGIQDIFSSDSLKGPVQYQNVYLPNRKTFSCIKKGLLLVKSDEIKTAIFISKDEMFRFNVKMDIATPSQQQSEKVLREIMRLMANKNIYRGESISLSLNSRNSLQVHTHRIPVIERDSIILPDGLLEQIERLTIRFGERQEQLKKLGQHVKRGILFYGAPGTGKTFTAMYLANAMKIRTAILLTGRGMGLIEASCNMARALQPSLVIVEDVDLIAEERSRQRNCTTPVLFELLNEMDGLAGDTDAIFLLTTNRPEILEPALMARPGRIDQTIEFPLPDAQNRKRLFELYSQGFTLKVRDLDRFISKTEGASAAFIKELLRRAALYSVDDGNDSIVEERYLDEALTELVIHGGEMTRKLLGYKNSPPE